MRTRPPLHSILCLSLALAAGGCAAAPAPEEPPAPVGWRVGAQEHIALWYHALALALPPREAFDTLVVPRFAPGYADSITEVKRSRGVYPTPLDQRAAEFGERFRADPAYQGLQFLPLYFRSLAAVVSGVELWRRTGGNPLQAPSAEAAEVVAFLSRLFPRPAQRDVVAEWTALVDQEAKLFYTAYWQELVPALQERAAAVQRAWDPLAPALQRYLDFIRAANGELFLVPALGAEGRLVTRGAGVPRAVVLAPPPAHPDQAVLAFVHELVYPVAGDAVRDYVAPARLREIGEEILVGRTAVRGGATLLAQTAPERVAAYQRFFLEAAGRPAPAETAALEAAFAAAFPLPDELARGLEAEIRRALAGI